jgi:low affinity Fe/Cu permease
MATKTLWFTNFAKTTAGAAGKPATFALAVLSIIIWAVLGPVFGYSDTWQLVINTATTIVTFLMVFLIQNTQNRDTQALHLKIDELIRATKGARNLMLALDKLDDKQLERLQAVYERLGEGEQAKEQKG